MDEPLRRVTLVSASSLTRAGLRAVLSTEAFVIAEVARLAVALQRESDLIVLDAEALEEVNLEGLSVLLLAGQAADIARLRALAPSHWGAVAVDAEPFTLRLAARAVAEGLLVFPPEWAPLEPVRPRPSVALESLTGRELEVLRLLVEGLANKRIALELGIAESTVKYHLEGIYAKLEVRSRAAAVRLALERGLVLL